MPFGVWTEDGDAPGSGDAQVEAAVVVGVEGDDGADLADVRSGRGHRRHCQQARLPVRVMEDDQLFAYRQHRVEQAVAVQVGHGQGADGTAGDGVRETDFLGAVGEGPLAQVGQVVDTVRTGGE